MRRGARIGLLGGSFNPAHAAHRHVSVEAMRQLGLDEVWWLVSLQNPLKADDGMAPLAARLVSARAEARHPRIRPMTIEASLGTRYTVDTLRALRRRHPGAHFVWLMGADNLAQFDRWKEWRGIARLVPIAVFGRPGYIGAALTAPAMGWLRRFRRSRARVRQWAEWRLPAIVILDIRLSALSATAVRAARPDWADRMRG